MRSILVPHHPKPAGVHPALQSFADECGAVAIRLLAYMGVLALVVMAAVTVFDGLEFDFGSEPPAKAGWSKAGWSVASRSHPNFAVSQFDSSGKTSSYEIFRHPEGGRKDVLRWASPGETPVAELELYRPGAEAGRAGPPGADIAGRMDPGGVREVVGEGIIDTKFGPVALMGFADRLKDSKRCLGFMKTLDAANLRISGWSCQGDGLPARRAAIGCTLNRLVLLTAGNEPRLQDAFAQAELKRAGCISGAALSATSADWVTGAQNPLLRGSL
ncbi:hypothetical protein SAMN03159423_1640 [Bradyrhizobium sp. NFR13]|uniref:hypothetical protein n=1 Tax=Bradyrhizobium sp. NFR13 TaxID=1566285 RepID=UPI0008EFEE5C|nr:hypothetical protein [Bradyrhizobium sp. NFR13]SFL38376.1 hypothetical protein SAMN03159423_1640 [Bradyrhizobium sp. NFR13]